ncbi:unnamed protein product, partial [Laminaria digitata]
VPVDFSFTGNPIQYKVYGDRAIVYVPFSVAADAALGERALEIKVRYQACDDTICLAPDQATVATTLQISADAPISAELGELFTGYDPTKAAASDGGASPPAGDSEPSNASPAGTFFGIALPGGGLGGFLVLGLLGAAGGLVLNLTPCVLPVIPIKVMTLSQHAGEHRGKAAMLGFWMALGVVAFWAALAIPVLTLQNFTDPSRIFGIWWLTAGIGLLIAIMSLGLMGMFQINLPQKV